MFLHHKKYIYILFINNRIRTDTAIAVPLYVVDDRKNCRDSLKGTQSNVGHH